MNIKRETILKWVILGIAIILASALAFNGTSSIGRDRELPGKKNIAFITKIKSSEYWDTVKMGASAAAKEYEVNVNFDGTESESDSEGQIRLIEGALKNKADALVLAASDFDDLAPIVESTHGQKIPVILAESRVNSSKYDSFIGSDNLEAGRQAGEKLVWLVGAKAKVLVVSYNSSDQSAAERETGLREILNRQKGVEVLATIRVGNSIGAASITVGQQLEVFSEVDGIVALDELGSIAAAEVIQNRGLAGKIKLVAFGNAKEEIEMLDNGVVQAMVVQNPFTIGYMAVKNAVIRLNGGRPEPLVHTQTKVIDATNMYLQENQKLLFPFAN